MDLDVNIQKLPRHEIAITEIITHNSDGYAEPGIDYDPLLRRGWYRYTDTAAIDIVFKETSSESTVECMFVTFRNEEEEDDTASVSFSVSKDGLYSANHIVIPTEAWFNLVKDDPSLHEVYPEYIYYIDEYTNIYRVDSSDTELKSKISVETLIDESNIDGTTILIKNFSVFCTHFLEQCYIKACRELFANYDKRCPTVDSNIRFNRDFIWMTLNVINYLLDEGLYLEAQTTLEELSCYNFCSNGDLTQKKGGCGCVH